MHCVDCKSVDDHFNFELQVPGQNSWVESSHDAMRNEYTNPIHPQREKRQREDDTTMADVDVVYS